MCRQAVALPRRQHPPAFARLKRALAEMRALLVELRPTALTDTPLPDLLQHLTAALSGRHGCRWSRGLKGARRCRTTQVALYRVAQEALQKVAKHAKAQHVWVTVWPGPDVSS